MKKIISVVAAGLISLSAVAQIPSLNSNPSATATIYMDFDGQYIDGTGWNYFGPIDAQPAGLTEATIREIFERVSEDYGIFNINVTTDSAKFAAAPQYQRIRMIVTTTSNWYGMVGGTSFTNSFRFGDGTPGWVFSANLSYDAKNIAEAVSHEAGHTLGLFHQSNYDGGCAKTAEYSIGQGSGEIGWAPIMGMGYTRNMTTWHTGSNAKGCNSIQNDIDIIAGPLNGFGLKTDDHGNSTGTSTSITLTSLDFQATGLINNYADRDVFRFTLDHANNVRINAIPQNVGVGNNGANVDIKVGLVSAINDTIGKYNPSELLNAGVDTNLNAGTYYIVVDGVANQNLPAYGSVGSYALAGQIANVLPIHHFALNAKINSELHELNWSYKSDEPIKKINVEISKDGHHFSTLAEVAADTRNYSWKPLDNSVNYYRVKVITVADERSYYSNIENLKNLQGKNLDILSTVFSNAVSLISKEQYGYQLIDETGRLLQQGVIKQGSNHIAVNSSKKGLMLLRVLDGAQGTTYKLLKQ
ncbi:MAG: hypothetical protein EOO02_05605 [Chitinophagaceae bacterium]|nr:MAG: hypothetical protein EOO02_05605 [Chitinophagaceae bacterium]